MLRTAATTSARQSGRLEAAASQYSERLFRARPFATPIPRQLIITNFTSMTSSAGLEVDQIKFGSFNVSDQEFYANSSAAAIVNLKPIVPGHVLVIPKKQYARLADVPSRDLAQLFEAVQFVGKVVERAYASDSLSIAIQDGLNAGQTVDHLHVHIIPRRAGDITPNDKIYEYLERFGLELRSVHEKQVDSDRRPRTQEQMNAEAAWLRVQCQSLSYVEPS